MDAKSRTTSPSPNDAENETVIPCMLASLRTVPMFRGVEHGGGTPNFTVVIPSQPETAESFERIVILRNH